jgi:hypothetical protein
VSDLAAALIAALDEQALDALADALWPRLRRRLELPVADAWLPTAQAAEYVGLTVDALHHKTAAREVPFSQEKPGAPCFFLRSELDAWRRESHHEARNGAAAAV